MANSDTSAVSEPSSNNFLVDVVPDGTLSNVADTLDLLSNIGSEGLGKRSMFGLYLLLSQCSEAVRHVQHELEASREGSHD